MMTIPAGLTPSTQGQSAGNDEFLYRGRRIQAAPAVHAEAIAILRRLAPPDARVLDVGAGEGALTLRGQDAGFQMACTTWNDKAVLEGIPAYRIDLDDAFDEDSVGGVYDAVLCIEIIEHVQNPARLLASMRRVLSAKGHLILSTPNVESALSRLQVLRRGYPDEFSVAEVVNNRHIWVPYRNVLERLCGLAGFEIIERRFMPEELRVGSGLRRRIKRAVLAALRATMRGDVRGHSRLYVLRKTELAAADASESYY